MSTALSVAFYIAISAIAACGAYMAQKSQNWKWMLCPFLIFTFVAGFRADSVGVDTEANLAAFRACLNNGNLFVSKEFLYYHLGAAILRIGNIDFLVLLFYGAIIYALVMARLWDFRATTNLGIAVFLYGLYFFGGSLNGMRQYVAISIIFFATRFLKYERYVLFALLTLLATCFHVSAVVAFVFILFRIGFRTYYTVRQAFIGLIAMLSVVPIVYICYTTYSGYLSSLKFDMGIMNVAQISLLVASFLLSKSARSPNLAKANTGKYEDNTSFTYAFVVSFTGLSLGFASYFVEYASRMGYYFRLFEIIYYGKALSSARNDKSLRLAFFLALTLIGVYYVYKYNGIIPYRVSF